MFSLRKKIVAIILLFVMVLCIACGEKAESETASESSSAMEGTIEVEDNLPDKDIKIPNYLKEENDSESPADKAEDDDISGSDEISTEPIYHLSGEEQAQKAHQVAAEIEDSINQVLTDKEFYPNITGISVNSECTEFNVTFSGNTLSLYENVLPVSLCIVGDRFQLYQGKQEDELLTVVNYIDENSGEIFNTTTSKEIK